MKKDRVPDFVLERLALGELSGEEAARAQEALGDESEARLAALAKEDAEILERLPPSSVAAEVRRRIAVADARSAPARTGGVPLWIPAVALAGAAVLAWLWIRPDVAPPPPSDTIARSDAPPGDDQGGTSEVVYVKGDARLFVDRLGPRGSERLSHGDAVGEGDRLQLRYDATDHDQGVIVSIDGRGVTTLHFPDEAADAPALVAGGAVALDHSYELDDAPAFERFFFVTAPRGRTLTVEAVMDAARALARGPGAQTEPLPLPADLAQASILLHKR